MRKHEGRGRARGNTLLAALQALMGEWKPAGRIVFGAPGIVDYSGQGAVRIPDDTMIDVIRKVAARAGGVPSGAYQIFAHIDGNKRGCGIKVIPASSTGAR